MCENETAPTTTTAAPTTTTAAPTTTTAGPTTTSSPTTTTASLTTTTAAPTTTTAAPTTTTAAPTTTTAKTTTTTTAKTTTTTTAKTTTTTTAKTTTTTTTTEAPPPVFVVAVTVVQPFVPEYNDRNSKEFKELEVKVIAVYNIIYRARFGIFFVRSYIIAFRPAITRFRMNGTRAEVEVEFNRTTPVETIPKAETVQQVLVEAVKNPNITLNVTFDENSIEVIRTPSTTKAPALNTTVSQNSTATINITSPAFNVTTNATTSTLSTPTTVKPTPTVEQTVTRVLTFRSPGETFTIDLLNPSSTAFINRAALLKSTLEPFYRQSFSSFRDLTVTSFSNGSIINNMTLRFASASGPIGSQIGQVLVNAASDITAFTIDTTSISVDGTPTATTAPTTTTATTTTPTTTTTTTKAPTTTTATTTTTAKTTTTTTTASTTTTTTEAPPPVFVVAATVVQPFVPEYNDRNSKEFKELEVKVIAVYDIIYRARFGIFFVRSYIIAFRPAITRFRMNGTQAEVGVEFNKTTPVETIPKAETVQEVLVEAVKNPNITLNVTFDENSIEVIRTPSTTEAPALNTTFSQNSTTNVSTPTTVKPTTTTTRIPTVGQTVTRVLTFRSPGETFTIDLLNPSSTAFINRAALLKSTLAPFYRQSFSSFRDLTVTSFSNGSIINNMTLRYTSAPAPNGSQIAQVLVNATSDITAFTIDTTSISVDGTPTATTAPTTTSTTTKAPTTTTAKTTTTTTTTTKAPTTTTTTTKAPTTTPKTTTTTTTTTKAPTTTTAKTTTTTTTTEAPPPVFVVAVTVVQPFVPEYNDRNSKEFKELEVKVIAVYNIIYRARFGIFFVRSYIIAFRPAITRFRMNGTRAEVEVEFNRTTPVEAIPKAETVQQVLVEAVKNPNITLNVTFDENSIEVIRTPSTTKAPALNTTVSQNSTATINTTTPALNVTTNATTSTLSTPTTVKPTPTVVQTVKRVLTFRSPGETFTIDLLNSSSPAFKDRAALLKSTLEPVYQRSIPSFLNLIVISFRNGSVINEMDLEFTSASATNDTEIRQVLVKEASSIKNFTIEASSVTVGDKAPALNTTVSQNSTTNVSTPTTVKPTTTTRIPTVEQTVTRVLTFRSPGETFTIDLLNPSSTAFINRAALLKSTLAPFYRQSFSSFRDLTVTSFSNGSIINNIILRFASTSVPNGFQIAQLLINAASDITAFTIDITSISVDGTQVSSGVSHKISVITAFCMVLLSWLLSSQH
ncbi:uncharacterized protein V3H82_014166 [Fundulus diaphanus]